MAPEQARGRGITPASDVYSIGVMLFEMLAGHPPFGGGSPVEVALRHLQDPVPPLPPTTSRALRAVVERALAKDPEQRYRDGGEMADALARTRHSRRPVAPAPQVKGTVTDPEPEPRRVARTLIGPRWSPKRTVSPAARRRTLTAFAVVIVLLLTMVAGAIVTAGAAQVRTPDLSGLTRAAIGTRLAAEHLRATLRTAYSARERGTAIAQSPSPGTLIAGGSRVTVTLSGGPAPVAVPRVVGFSTADAESSLRQLGLHPALRPVPAPGVTPGSVTAETPPPGVKLTPGSTVSLSVAETPRWREVTTFSGTSAPFRIRGTQWRIVYRMAYNGTCTFLFFCSGPAAHVASLDRGTVSSFDLSEGSGQIRTFSGGPGMYQVTVSPGDDSATWSAQIQDYY
jgi:eukaryotic-like serine/threonine-protein kinase